MNKIKIALGMQLQKGAFGGGNQFGSSLADFLVAKGVDVVFDLNDEDIDIILLTETRKYLKSCSFDPIDVGKYLFKNPDTLVVFRVNECDERKGRRLKLLNRLIVRGTEIADHTIFISEWLKEVYIKRDQSLIKKSSIIHNGADITIFNSNGYKRWDTKEPLRIVTHHWGAHWFKGFDIYLKLDALIKKKYKDEIEFTFIGGVPKDVKFKNTNIIPPKSGRELAQEIKKHHIYLTASINEPAGMHHIEGALCGLPLLYRTSGALPEYCKNFGVSFSGQANFEESLSKLIQEYDYWEEQMQYYENTAEKMCQNYYDLFGDLIEEKRNIISRRNLNRIALYKYILSTKVVVVMTWIKEKADTLHHHITPLQNRKGCKK